MLAHCDLLGLVDRFDLEVKDRRRKADLLEALMSTRQVRVLGLLESLPMSALRRAAVALGVERRPRRKTELVAKLVDLQTSYEAQAVGSTDEVPGEMTGRDIQADFQKGLIDVDALDGREVRGTKRLRQKKPLLVVMERDFPDELVPGEIELLTPFRDRLLEGIGTQVENGDEGGGKGRE